MFYQIKVLLCAWPKQRKQHPHPPPFLVRPICPSLGALCPSLWGLPPPPSPFTWGCPGSYWPAGPGCRGGPLARMSSGIPDAPYISRRKPSPGRPLDVRTAQGFASCPKASHFRNGIQHDDRANDAPRTVADRTESPRNLRKKPKTSRQKIALTRQSAAGLRASAHKHFPAASAETTCSALCCD